MAGYNLSKLEILVVDDNFYMLNIIETMLRSMGIEKVRCFRDVKTALSGLKEMPPDIIITDCHMQPVSGIELVKRIRDERGPCPYVPIIMLTGFTELDRVVEARDAGVSDFLKKPISAQTLYERIVELIENPKPFIRDGDYFGPEHMRSSLGNTNSKPKPKPQPKAGIDIAFADESGPGENEFDNLGGGAVRKAG